jgi:hypothetical protein
MYLSIVLMIFFLESRLFTSFIYFPNVFLGNFNFHCFRVLFFLIDPVFMLLSYLHPPCPIYSSYFNATLNKIFNSLPSYFEPKIEF